MGMKHLAHLVDGYLAQYGAAEKKSDVRTRIINDIIRTIVDVNNGGFQRRLDDGTLIIEEDAKIKSKIQNRFLDRYRRMGVTRTNQLVAEYREAMGIPDPEAAAAAARVPEGETSDRYDDSGEDIDSLGDPTNEDKDSDSGDDERKPSGTTRSPGKQGRTSTSLKRARSKYLTVYDGRNRQTAPPTTQPVPTPPRGSTSSWPVPATPEGFVINGVSAVTMFCEYCGKLHNVPVWQMSKFRCPCR